MTDTSSIQPLLPDENSSRPLLERAAVLQAAALRLVGLAGPWVAKALEPALRAMNSYYTNRIEGQHTRPADIERALRSDFDTDASLARRQRLALAHMEAERQLEAEFDGHPHTLLSAAAIVRIHRCLHALLPPEDRRTDQGDEVVPGVLREREVIVGRHVAPDSTSVPALLEGWAEGYGRVRGGESLLVATACAHHRLVWIHPFRDGNGRVARLHSHLLLRALGLTAGLWSPMRGLARTRDRYFAHLQSADLPRRNDLDGRGALSQEELVSFAAYFLDCCADQVRFLEGRLALNSLKDGLADLLRHLEQHPWPVQSGKSVVKPDCLEALHYCAVAGPLDRGRFTAMTGLGERTGRRVLASLLDFGILQSDSARSPVSFAMPRAALRFVLPGLWPESDID